MSLVEQIDAGIDDAVARGAGPVCLVLTFEQRRALTVELHGSADYREPGQHPYALFVSSYRGLPIVATLRDVGKPGAVAIGVRA